MIWNLTGTGFGWVMEEERWKCVSLKNKNIEVSASQSREHPDHLGSYSTDSKMLVQWGLRDCVWNKLPDNAHAVVHRSYCRSDGTR